MFNAKLDHAENDLFLEIDSNTPGEYIGMLL
jgi:hypothetical protein